MSFYKTFKAISKRGTINGVNYELEEYTTYYHPYNRISMGEPYTYAKKGEVDMAIFNLTIGNNSLNSEMATDQFDNNWYKDGSMTGGKWIAYANGKPLCKEPMSYYNACQFISKHANLPKTQYGDYEYCYKYMNNCHNKGYKAFDGEYVPNYENMFEVKFKVGDRVFYVKEYDSDTRNGARKQIESFIIRDIDIACGEVYYFNHSADKSYSSFSDVRVAQYRVRKSVEELCEMYSETLYMWHRNGSCCIEPCKSTNVYMAYNGNED